MGGFTDGARVEPAHCADHNKAAMEAQSAPGTTAMQTGTSGDSPVSIAVTTVTSAIEGQRAAAERCPTMTMVLPMEGMEATVESRNSIVDAPAPEGVEHFVAVAQDSTMALSGTTQETSAFAVNGVVRGIGITVTTIGMGGAVPEAARQAALDAFAKQAEKIRNA